MRPVQGKSGVDSGKVLSIEEKRKSFQPAVTKNKKDSFERIAVGGVDLGASLAPSNRFSKLSVVSSQQSSSGFVANSKEEAAMHVLLSAFDLFSSTRRFKD